MYSIKHFRWFVFK